MALNRAQTLLYVSEDNSDTLAVIDTANNKILGELGVTAPADLLGELDGFSAAAQIACCFHTMSARRI